jgi:hypothetical protein
MPGSWRVRSLGADPARYCVGVVDFPLQALAHRLPDGVVVPDEPSEWLAALMEPWDEWAVSGIQPLVRFDDLNAPCYRSWRRAYALMPKSQSEWDARVRNDPPLVDHDGATWDQGLRGLSRRLFVLHAVEGDGVASDVHPLRAMERQLCTELAALLAFETPPSWPDVARIELALRIAECRGLLYCFACWQPDRR